MNRPTNLGKHLQQSKVTTSSTGTLTGLSRLFVLLGNPPALQLNNFGCHRCKCPGPDSTLYHIDKCLDILECDKSGSNLSLNSRGPLRFVLVIAILSYYLSLPFPSSHIDCWRTLPTVNGSTTNHLTATATSFGCAVLCWLPL